jgi:shikimate kinase
MTFTLIGMPGSGKSCMGRALARKLKTKNIDTDALIERTTGIMLQDIINTDRVDAFKVLEE